MTPIVTLSYRGCPFIFRSCFPVSYSVGCLVKQLGFTSSKLFSDSHTKIWENGMKYYIFVCSMLHDSLLYFSGPDFLYYVIAHPHPVVLVNSSRSRMDCPRLLGLRCSSILNWKNYAERYCWYFVMKDWTYWLGCLWRCCREVDH